MPSEDREPENRGQSPGAFFDEYGLALASQQWERVSPLIHDDCTAVFSSGTFVGIDQVEAAFRRTFDMIDDERYAITNLRWLDVSDDRVVALYDFTWEGIIAGDPASGGGRGTAVLAKSPRGWQILLEHLGPPAPSILGP